jgi:hypothetical protein
VHVDFLVRGESVHQCEIALRVVPAPLGRTSLPQTPGPGPGSLMRADRAIQPPTQQIRLSLGMAGGHFRLGLADLRGGDLDFTDDFVEPDWGRIELETLLKRLDTALAGCYENAAFWSTWDGTPAHGDAGQEMQACLARSCEAVAHAGAVLNAWLRASPRIAAALDYIEAHAQDGAVISISTDNIFLPWELLYPRPWAPNATTAMRQAHPLRLQAFWGARFAIETEKRGIGALGELRERHRRAPARVSMNLNPDIAVRGLKGPQQPIEVQRAWARQLEHNGMLEGLHDDCDAMRNVLQNGDSAARLLYIYCHGDSPQPLSGANELLLLDGDCELMPEDLRHGKHFAGAPIVILNSCRGAVFSPLTFSSFLREFHGRGALGLIAASYAVPIVFAAHFGAELVRCALRPAGLLAEAMRALRCRHLLIGNPVPLFYAIQCHLDIEETT